MAPTVPGLWGEPHQLITFHGGLGGGETWSFGLRTGSEFPAASDLQSWADYVAQCGQALFDVVTGLGSLISTNTSFIGVSIRNLSVAGITVSLAEKTPAVQQHGTSTTKLPGQVCLVASLMTHTPGRHGKGRIYLPMTGVALDGSDNFPVGSIQAVPDKVTNLINQLQGYGTLPTPTFAGPFPRMCVQSRTSGQQGAPITGVRVGNVMDTQRRRRRKKIELYTQGAEIVPN